MQAILLLAWQPAEVLWSDPQVLAYLDGPAPTHAQDHTQPACLENLLATNQAFEAEFMKLVSNDQNSLKSGMAALVQSKALLVLGRIIHWLQQSLNPSILEPGAPTWIGSALWRTATRVLWRLATFLEQCHEREELLHCHPSACVQLLGSGKICGYARPYLMPGKSQFP